MKSITNLVTVGQYTTKLSLRQLAPKIQLVLNSTVHRITGCTPMELLTGRKSTNLPGSITVTEDVCPSVRPNMSTMRQQAKENIDKATEYEIQRFIGKGAKVTPLSVGDLCVRQVEPRISQKTSLKFKGLYKVKEVLPHDHYILTNLNTGHEVKYSHERVRKLSTDISLLPTLLDEDESGEEE